MQVLVTFGVAIQLVQRVQLGLHGKEQKVSQTLMKILALCTKQVEQCDKQVTELVTMRSFGYRNELFLSTKAGQGACVHFKYFCPLF